jgi:hypothetical protein
MAVFSRQKKHILDFPDETVCPEKSFKSTSMNLPNRWFSSKVSQICLISSNPKFPTEHGTKNRSPAASQISMDSLV